MLWKVLGRYGARAGADALHSCCSINYLIVSLIFGMICAPAHPPTSDIVDESVHKNIFFREL